MLYLMTSSQQQSQDKASILIWMSIFFIACQSVKLVPDLYEAFYCTHKKVSSKYNYMSYIIKYILWHFYSIKKPLTKRNVTGA